MTPSGFIYGKEPRVRATWAVERVWTIWAKVPCRETNRISLAVQPAAKSLHLMQYFGVLCDRRPALILRYCRDYDISHRVPSLGSADRGSNPGMGTRCFSSPESPGRVWDPPSSLFNGYRSSLRGVERLGREADYSPPSGTRVKSEWSYSSDPLHAFTA